MGAMARYIYVILSRPDAVCKFNMFDNALCQCASAHQTNERGRDCAIRDTIANPTILSQYAIMLVDAVLRDLPYKSSSVADGDIVGFKVD